MLDQSICSSRTLVSGVHVESTDVDDDDDVDVGVGSTVTAMYEVSPSRPNVMSLMCCQVVMGCTRPDD